MVGLIFSIIFLVAGTGIGIALSRTSEIEDKCDEYGNYIWDENHRHVKEKVYPMRKFSWISYLSGFVLAGICLIASVTVSIPTGYTGIPTVFGRVEDYTLDSGVHLKAPWVSVTKMDNRVQKAEIELLCFSSDIQEVNCKYTLNYQIDKSSAQNLYKTVGVNYYDTAITPVVAESVKTVMAHYTAEELIGSRDALATAIEELLNAQLEKYNIVVVSTAIEDLDFTDSFTDAVEAKQVAAQNKLKAEIEQAQAVKQAEADAQVARTKAEAEAEVAKVKAAADAEVAKIQAEADLEVQKINADAAEYTGQKEAAKNKAINESLTGDLLDYYFIQQWNGKYPEYYVGSDNVSTIVGLPGTGSEENSK